MAKNNNVDGEKHNQDSYGEEIHALITVYKKMHFAVAAKYFTTTVKHQEIRIL